MLDSSAIGFGASDGIRIRDQELGKHANRSETVADQRSWPIPEHPLPSRSVGQPSLWTPDGHPCTRIGVPAYRNAGDVALGNILLLPFRRQRDDWSGA